MPKIRWMTVVDLNNILKQFERIIQVRSFLLVSRIKWTGDIYL